MFFAPSISVFSKKFFRFFPTSTELVVCTSSFYVQFFLSWTFNEKYIVTDLAEDCSNFAK